MFRQIAMASALGVTLLAGIAAQGAEPPRATTPADTGAEVRRLFNVGQAAFAKQDYEGAYKAFLAAWALQKSYDIAGNLSSAEMKLGKLRDAAEHMDFALRNFPPTGDPKQREALRARSVKLMAQVGRVRVRVSVEGAAVTVNGVAVGSSPVDAEVFVPPGEVIVEARREGFTEGRAVLEVHPGPTAKEVTVTLEPIAAPSPVTTEPPRSVQQPPAEQPPAAPRLLPIVIGGGAAIVALGVGVGLTVAANGETSDASALRGQQTASWACSGGAGSSGSCAALRDALETKDALSSGAVAAFVLGGMLAAGTAGFAVWELSRDRSERVVRVVPAVGPRVGGAAVVGRW